MLQVAAETTSTMTTTELPTTNPTTTITQSTTTTPQTTTTQEMTTTPTRKISVALIHCENHG